MELPKEDPATIQKFLSTVATEDTYHSEENALATKLALLRQMNPGGVGSNEFILSAEAKADRLKRQREAANLLNSTKISETINWSEGLFGGKPAVAAGKRGQGSVPANDTNPLAKMQINTISGATCSSLAKPTDSNACPAGQVAKAVAGTWEKAKKDKQYAFDVCCEPEPSMSEPAPAAPATSVIGAIGSALGFGGGGGGGTATTTPASKNETPAARFFSEARANEAAVYRFLKRVELDMSVINNYFEKFGPAVEQKFNSEPETRQRFVKAMDDLKFVWRVISSEMTYCSEQLRNAETVAKDFSYEEARSDLVFSGCGPELVGTLFVSAKVLYFKRLRTLTTIMKKVVANYDYEKYAKEREEIGQSNSYTVSKWVQLLGTNVRESFESTYAFVKYQVGGLGAVTMIAFGAGILAVMMMVATGLGPLGVLGAIGVNTPITSAAVATLQGYGATVAAAAGGVLESITTTILSYITITIPAPVLTMMAAMPALCWLLQRMDVVSKAMMFMREQILNYVSGSGHVYRGLRSLFNKFTVLASQAPQFRSAVLAASADDIVSKDADFFEQIEQRAKTPELGLGMSLLARFLNMFIGMMSSGPMRWVIWFCSVGTAVANSNVVALGVKGASAVAYGATAVAKTVTDMLGTDFGTSAAIAAASAEISRMTMNGGEGGSWFASPIEEFSKFKEEVSTMKDIANEQIIQGMTMENLTKVAWRSVKNSLGFLGMSLPDYKDDDEVYVPTSIWDNIAKIGNSSSDLIRTILGTANQKVYKESYDALKGALGDQYSDIPGFVSKALWGFSPEQITKMYEQGVTDKTLVIRFIESSAFKSVSETIGWSSDSKTDAYENAVLAYANKLREKMLNGIEKIPDAMAELKKNITTQSLAIAKKKFKNAYVVWVPQGSSDEEADARKLLAIQEQMEKLVETYKVQGLFNAVVENLKYIKVTVCEFVDKAGRARGLVELDSTSMTGQLANMSNRAQIEEIMKKAGVEGYKKFTLPADWAGLSDEDLAKAFNPNTLAESSEIMRGYTLRGAARTVQVKVQDYVAVVQKNVEDTAKEVLQTLGLSTDPSNWSLQDIAWLLGIVMLFMAAVVTTFYFTKMSVEEVFTNTELEDKVVKDLLAKHGDEIQQSLELFGRVRRVPNAAAVYQRARAVHGKSSEQALQAVAQAFAYNCPPGSGDKCTQPDAAMFDMSKIRLVPPPEAAGTITREQQQKLMLARLMARMQK